MADVDTDDGFKIIASLCGSCGCGCPTVLESADGENLVIVGAHDEIVLSNDVVKKKIGENETAIVISKEFLLNALKSYQVEV